MSYETLLVEETDGYARITLNRPDKLNALNAQLLEELGDALVSLQSAEDVHALIITGSGSKAFAAGADIAELHACDAASGVEFARRGQAVFKQIEYFSKPVIAAVNGFALGGGCELALACHMRFAAEKARFGQPEVNLGIIPGYGGTQRLTRLVGRAKAIELILGGGVIDAETAQTIGLVNGVYPAEELMDATLAFVKIILSKGQVAVRNALQSIIATDELSPSAGMDFEAERFGATTATADFKEGTLAFLEKRPAKFTNR